jgi:hypothetical protein
VPGPLLNQYDWGGYIVWKLWPRVPVYIDGRADVYGDQMMKQYDVVTNLRKDWRSVLDQWEIRAILLPAGAPLVTGLQQQGGWQQAYADGEAVVLTKK